MCVMWLKLEGALIILLRRSVFLKTQLVIEFNIGPLWTCKSTKSLIKHSCSKLFSSVCVYAKVYGVLVLMLV